MLTKEDVEGLEIISDDDFSDIVDSIILNDYRSIPNAVRLPNLKAELAEKLGLEKDAAFILKKNATHIRPDRKGGYGQAFDTEEYRRIPEVLRNADFAIVDNVFLNFQIVFDDENDGSKINKLVFNKDELGNYLVTIGKVDRENAFAEERNIVVAVGVAPTIQTLRTSASSTALRASTTTNNQNLSQEKPYVKSVGEQLAELDSRIWNELGIGTRSDFTGHPEKIKSYASPVKDYLDANGIKKLDRETFSFLEAINYHTLNNILGLHGVYGEEFRRRAIERSDSPYSNYDRNTALEIVNGISREEIVDKGIERMQENGGVSDSAAEAEMNVRDNPRADYIDEDGNPHWFDEEEEEVPEIGQYSPEAINFSPDSSAELVKYYSEFEIPLEEDEAKKMLEVLERNGMTLSYDPVVNDIVVNVYKIDGEKHNYFPEDLREIQEIVASLDGGNVSIPTHPGEINNLVNKIKTPDQLVYAAARVGRMIEQHTQNVQSVVNRDMVSRLSTVSEPTNKEYDSSKLLSSAEMFFPAIRKLETIIKET